MRILIFGCGYLGLRVARLWRNAGHSVTGVTRSDRRAADLRSEGIEPWIGDICDPASLRGVPSAEIVLFAVGFDPKGGHSRESVMVDGLQSALQAVGECQTFLVISSTSVYGQSAGEWVDEDSPTQPQQAGGVCGLASEAVVRTEGPRHAGRWNILRLSGIYGPGRLLTRVEGLRQGVPMAGLAEAWLNLIHVDDAAQAVCDCALRGAAGATYLVSDDQPVTRGEYYGRLAELGGTPPPVFDPTLAPARGSGGLNKRCSNRRLREELQVALKYPTFSAGLQHVWTSAGPAPARPEPPAG